LLFELKPLDVLTHLAVAIVLLAKSLLAAWLPARRAARADPLRAMRTFSFSPNPSQFGGPKNRAGHRHARAAQHPHSRNSVTRHQEVAEALVEPLRRSFPCSAFQRRLDSLRHPPQFSLRWMTAYSEASGIRKASAKKVH